jgi:hypothetical protein
MFGSNWIRWLRLFWRTWSARQPARARVRRLRLEALEDRLVPSTITGHVLQDQTGNGLSLDDTALGHVKVVLYQDRNNDGKLDSGDRVVATQRTAADGSFSFDHLAAGTYFVAEQTPRGFVRTDPTTTPYTTIHLDANQIAFAEFDNFKRVHTGAIRDVSFTITDPTGKSHTVTNLRGNTQQGDTVTVNFTVVGHSPVRVSLVAYNAPGNTFDASTASEQVIFQDASETFSPGAHSLTVQLPNNFYQVDFVAGAAIDTFGPAGSNIFYSAERRLISADNGGTNPVAQATLSGTAFVDNSLDQVFNAQWDGTLSFVTVQLRGTNALGTVSYSTTTGTDGTYQFPNLLPGTYTLTYFGVGAYEPESSPGNTNSIVQIPITVAASNLTVNLPEIPLSSNGGPIIV